MKSKPVDTIDLTETDDEFCPIAADDDDDDDNDTVSCHSIMSASSKSSDALRSMLINSWLHNVISWHLVTELFVLKQFYYLKQFTVIKKYHTTVVKRYRY